MNTDDEFTSEAFFRALDKMAAEEALDRCIAKSEEWRAESARLAEQLAQTPRGDKAGAHIIKQEIKRLQARLQRMKPVLNHYRSAIDKKEAHGLWVDGVRAVCGQDKLREVYDWMTAEKKLRKSAARTGGGK